MKLKSADVFQNKTLTDLIEYLSERLQNPVLLETTEFELITYSGDYQLLDDVRRNTILGKKAPSPIIECLIEEKIVDAINTSTEPIRLPAIEKIDFSERVAFCVRHASTPIAYLWIQEASCKLSKRDFALIKVIGNEIATIMKQDTVPPRPEDYRLFTKLLDGHYTSEKMVHLEAEMAGIKIPKDYVIVVFYAQENQKIATILKYVRSFCLYENKHSFFVKNENQLTVVIGKGNALNETLPTIANRLVKVIVQQQDNEETINVGVSHPATNILNMRIHYLEALEVINVRKTFGFKNIPYAYQELGIYRLLSVVQEKYTKEGYLNETIFTLKKYDIENHTELLTTLEKYLTCNCKAKDTAAALFIHPNTLNYRLKRIIDLTQLQFDDINQRTILYIDLLLQNYKE